MCICFASESAPWKACQVIVSKMEGRCLLNSFLLRYTLVCWTSSTFNDGRIEFFGDKRGGCHRTTPGTCRGRQKSLEIQKEIFAGMEKNIFPFVFNHNYIMDTKKQNKRGTEWTELLLIKLNYLIWPRPRMLKISLRILSFRMDLNFKLYGELTGGKCWYLLSVFMR